MIGLTGALLTSLGGASTEAELTEVRLYPEGGEQLRRVTVEGSPGEGGIVIEGLPGRTEPADIRARLVEGEGATLGAIRFERLSEGEIPVSPEREAAEAEVRRLGQELEDLNRRITEAGDRAAVYTELRKAYLEGIKEAPEAGLGEQVLEALEEERAALDEKRSLERELADAIRELQREKRDAERRLQEIRRAELALNGRVTIELLGTTEGRVELELKSRVGGVGWQPAYRIEARPAEEEWILDYGARLRNQTGERWEGVDLVLLTGRSGWRMEAPELPPVYLSKPRPVEEIARREKGVALQAMAVAADRAMPPSPEAERLTTQFELRLPNPVSVEPFEADQRILLARESVPATFRSVVTPMLDETAYLHGEAEPELEWPLLAGEAVLLVDGAVSGRQRIAFTNPGEALEIGFGENPAITVEHKVMEVMERDSGLFDKVRKYQRHYETLVRNRMPVAHPVKVRGRFPVSRDDEIEVNRLEPAGLEVDPETGRFAWERELAAGAEATFTTRFEVVAPRDWNLPPTF